MDDGKVGYRLSSVLESQYAFVIPCTKKLSWDPPQNPVLLSPALKARLAPGTFVPPRIAVLDSLALA
jgi:hypothetical protein